MTVRSVLHWKEWLMVATVVPLTPSVLQWRWVQGGGVIDIFALGSVLAALSSVCQTGSGSAAHYNMNPSLLRFNHHNDACHVCGFVFERDHECRTHKHFHHTGSKQAQTWDYPQPIYCIYEVYPSNWSALMLLWIIQGHPPVKHVSLKRGRKLRDE